MPILRPGSLLRREKKPADPDIRRVEASDEVLTRWGLLRELPGPAEQAEFWVLDGQDGAPVGAGRLVPTDEPDTVELWIFVEPVVRHFGAGQRLWLHLEECARRRKARVVTSFATDSDGASFLAWHAFEAVGDRARLELE